MVKNDGTPIELNQTYTITVNNYMAGGGDGYAVLAGINNRTIDIVHLDAFVNYIKAKSEVNPQIEGRVTKLN